MRTARRGVLIVFTSLFVHGGLYAMESGGLKVEFTGMRSQEGYLAVSVFSEDKKDAFPGSTDNAVKTFYVKLESTSLKLDIDDLPPGRYAIAVMHDEDGNKKLKTGLFGIPREGFGFSQNPKVYFGAPSFEKVVFDAQETSALRISVRYFM